MQKFFLLAASTAAFTVCLAQPSADKTPSPSNFTIEKSIAATSVKNQAMTGTCWCFSTTSLVESQLIKNKLGEFDLSEMFEVRNVYIEKAKNYILRQGHAQFGEGGLGHDLIRAIGTYGAEPESVYSGLLNGQKQHNHEKLIGQLQKYLDSVKAMRRVPENWLDGYEAILDRSIGTPPKSFTYNGKEYTPKTFATDVMHFDPSDYVSLTSFTHHPYYAPFILEVPDNFSNGSFYNLPLNELIDVTKEAINKGYSISWDADVSNSGFQMAAGKAVNLDSLPAGATKQDVVDGKVTDYKANATRRQELFENLTTQDDHLMHITGLEKDKNGNEYFLVKNSWGEVGPNKGYINVSENYFGINTISLVVPKAALSKALLEKLKIK